MFIIHFVRIIAHSGGDISRTNIAFLRLPLLIFEGENHLVIVEREAGVE